MKNGILELRLKQDRQTLRHLCSALKAEQIRLARLQKHLEAGHPVSLTHLDMVQDRVDSLKKAVQLAH